MKYLMIIFTLLLIGVGAVGCRNTSKQNNRTNENLREDAIITEEFIHRWLTNENGTTATYIYDSGRVDEDLVQGRETLAETIGLWLNYALEENDQTLFSETFNQLEEFFLENDGFVNWKLNENGVSEVTTNAFIDDIRIMDALVIAHDRWGGDQYRDTAASIGNYLTEYNVNSGIYTNFYDRKYEVASADITLPYINIRALNNLVDQELLNAEVVDKTSRILEEAPLDNGFYPKVYNVEEDTYSFDDNVNIIDQAFVAYHYAQTGQRSEEFLAFIKEEIANRGLIHGMYNRKTKEPVVKYESPAIYGYLILYTLEIGEVELAQTIYNRVKEYQVVDSNSEYYGGYSITNGNTHIFDNLVPLFAEQQMKTIQ